MGPAEREAPQRGATWRIRSVVDLFGAKPCLRSMAGIGAIGVRPPQARPVESCLFLPAEPPHVRPRAIYKGRQYRSLTLPVHQGSQRQLHCRHLLFGHAPVFGRRAGALSHHHGAAYYRLPGRSRQSGYRNRQSWGRSSLGFSHDHEMRITDAAASGRVGLDPIRSVATTRYSRCDGRAAPGVCHNCEAALMGAGVSYRFGPVAPPADGNLLICCSQPQGDIALDL